MNAKCFMINAELGKKECQILVIETLHFLYFYSFENHFFDKFVIISTLQLKF